MNLKELDQKYIWHPFTQMADWEKEDPLVVDRADGCWLIDLDGNRYLDGVGSLWTNVHGHRHPAIDQAVRGQLEKVAHSTLLGLAGTPSIQLAEKIISIAPQEKGRDGLKKVFYSDSGSEAAEIALKMAYQYWQQHPDGAQPKRKKFISFTSAYHGDTIGSVSVGGMDLFHAAYRPLLFETIFAPYPYPYRAPEGMSPQEHCDECLNALGGILLQNEGEICAVVIEPCVQGAGGMIVAPEGFLRGVRDLTRRHNTLLIADEVATGFGRTGRMFACQHEDVCPDLMTIAKGLTGGYLPLAATLTTQDVYNAFLGDYSEQKTFFHGHTYTGNALACAAALASLEIFEKEKTLSKLPTKIERLERELARFAEIEHVGEVRQKGFMIGIELVRGKRTKEAYDWREQIGVRVCREARNREVILRPLGNVVVLMPPLAITEEEIDILMVVTNECIRRATAS